MNELEETRLTYNELLNRQKCSIEEYDNKIIMEISEIERELNDSYMLHLQNMSQSLDEELASFFDEMVKIRIPERNQMQKEDLLSSSIRELESRWKMLEQSIRTAYEEDTLRLICIAEETHSDALAKIVAEQDRELHSLTSVSTISYLRNKGEGNNNMMT
jgi:hypothetical protein